MFGGKYFIKKTTEALEDNLFFEIGRNGFYVNVSSVLSLILRYKRSL